MDAQPAKYLREALQCVGLSVQSLQVTHYSPESFGNLIALADTDIGILKITYDRMFYVDADQPLRNQVISDLIEALDSAKRRAVS